jgi:hypothetical protein
MLIDDIRNHLAVMNVGQRERRGAVLLREAAGEIGRLHLAIRRLAEQDATLSVCDGNVTVTMDATLTDAEREAIGVAIQCVEAARAQRHPEEEEARDLLWKTTYGLRSLLDRTDRT